MKKITLAIVSFLVVCMPLISIAHPGHGETGGYTITHYFTEPLHVAISAGVLFIVAVFIRRLRKSRQQQ